MKRTIITTFVSVLAGLCLGIFVAPKAQPVSAGVAIAAPVPAGMAVPVPARCPNIHEAVGALQSAESTLREARHDFCGHKADAMRTVHEAIEQLRAAEGCDRCR
jgi:hypothetical protein